MARLLFVASDADAKFDDVVDYDGKEIEPTVTWGINPGQQVWAFSTDNRYAAFYAEADDGAIWSDGYGPMLVYTHAFRICLGLGQTGAIGSVGCRLIDTTGRDTIVNLKGA